jgi:diacylglycerol kinase family enzyme
MRLAAHHDAGAKAMGPAPPLSARLFACGALLVVGVVVAALCLYPLRHIVYLLAAVAAVGIGSSAVWVAFTNRRWRWQAGFIAFGAGLGVVAALRGAGAGMLLAAMVIVGLGTAGLLGAIALRREVEEALRDRWRDAPGARCPVLLMNPRSGGGKVEKFRLVDECVRRGIGVIVLRPGGDLEALARCAVERGADVIGMAGGDGSQAVVAAVASERGIPFVCVPAGTRNHLALDLGVERDDVVGALDAYGPAREGTIDLATVNGRVFVNNVSLGLYGTMVASDEYREEKLRTAAFTIEQHLGPKAPPYDLHLEGPDGPIDDPQIVEVSNNPYLLQSLTTFGTRARIDSGTLGVVSVRVAAAGDLRRLHEAETARKFERFPGLRSWSTAELEVRSSSPVAAGIDGESCLLDPPIRFRSVPGALRVRVVHAHPGASPAMRRAPLTSSTVAGLWALARGRPSGLVA